MSPGETQIKYCHPNAAAKGKEVTRHPRRCGSRCVPLPLLDPTSGHAAAEAGCCGGFTGKPRMPPQACHQGLLSHTFWVSFQPQHFNLNADGALLRCGFEMNSSKRCARSWCSGNCHYPIRGRNFLRSASNGSSGSPSPQLGEHNAAKTLYTLGWQYSTKGDLQQMLEPQQHHPMCVPDVVTVRGIYKPGVGLITIIAHAQAANKVNGRG